MLEEGCRRAYSARGGGGCSGGVSAATATLMAVVLSVAGTLLGVMVGLVVEYWLRRRGVVRREARAWVGWSTGSASGSRTFEVRFFNARDVNISLCDAEVEFIGVQNCSTPSPPCVVIPEARWGR